MEEDVPQFGKLIEIVLTPSKEFFFITLQLITLQYGRHYHAYEVRITEYMFAHIKPCTTINH